MDFAIRLLTPADEIPVTCLEARDELHLLEPPSERRILAAAKRFEQHTRRALMPQTWLFESEGAVRAIELPRPPLLEILTVKSKDRIEDDWEDVDAADYVVEENRSPARLRWTNQQPRLIQVTYRAGHETREEIAEDYRENVLQLIVFAEENRGDVEAKIPTALAGWLDNNRAGTVLGYWYE